MLLRTAEVLGTVKGSRGPAPLLCTLANTSNDMLRVYEGLKLLSSVQNKGLTAVQLAASSAAAARHA